MVDLTDIRKTIAYCAEHADALDDRQASFVNDMVRLSEKFGDLFFVSKKQMFYL